jgi:uncharacterized protein YbbC (DUF1343 family)
LHSRVIVLDRPSPLTPAQVNVDGTMLNESPQEGRLLLDR